EGEVVVADRRYVAIFHQGVVKVPVEGLLEVADILDVDDAAHRDLLPLLVVAARHRHDDFPLKIGSRCTQAAAITRARPTRPTVGEWYEPRLLLLACCWWSPCLKVTHAREPAVTYLRRREVQPPTSLRYVSPYGVWTWNPLARVSFATAQ
ncbi:hypothetical protein X777_12429, partial [Ooceraea biroi]